MASLRVGGRRKAVCDQRPCGPVRSLELWVHWILPDLHGFYKWIFDSLGLLDECERQVVFSRSDLAVDVPRITGQDLFERWLRLRSPRLVVWMGGPGMR